MTGNSFLSLLFLFGGWTFNVNSATWPPTQYWDVDDFPNPRYDVSKCGRDGRSFLCDPNNVLSEKDAERIDEAISSFRKRTPCKCLSCPSFRGGFSMAVAVVPWLKLPPGTLRTDDQVQLAIEHFAVELETKRWNFGHCSDDAVIVLSKYDRRIFTSTARKTDIFLPSKCVDKASNSAKSKFKQNKYADAIIQMLHDFRKTINNNGFCDWGQTPPWRISVAVIGSAVAIFFFVVLICCVISITRKRRRGRPATGGGGGRNDLFYVEVAGSTTGHHHHHHHDGGHHGGGGGGFSHAGGGGGGTSW